MSNDTSSLGRAGDSEPYLSRLGGLIVSPGGQAGKLMRQRIRLPIGGSSYELIDDRSRFSPSSLDVSRDEIGWLGGFGPARRRIAGQGGIVERRNKSWVLQEVVVSTSGSPFYLEPMSRDCNGRRYVGQTTRAR